MQEIRSIAQQFVAGGSVVGIQPLGSGLINDTYLVESDSKQRSEWVLQKLNKEVFERPDWIMDNLSILTAHARQLKERGNNPITLRLPKNYATRDAKSYLIDGNGDYWRALEYIPNTQTLQSVRDQSDAEQIGFALGQFHRLVADLEIARLHDTLPGFHVCPAYFRNYQASLCCCKGLTESPELKYAIKFVSSRRACVDILEDAKQCGDLKTRTIHGDPKINNFLFDIDDHRAVSLIDLDTVKPGLLHYDIGDCLRSACNRQSEETQSTTAVRFDLDVFYPILKVYLAEAGSVLSDADFRYLYDAVRLLPFELGIRFLTDYLGGNQYFKVDYPEQNLTRALVQFQLTEAIEQQATDINKMIKRLSVGVAVGR